MYYNFGTIETANRVQLLCIGVSNVHRYAYVPGRRVAKPATMGVNQWK